MTKDTYSPQPWVQSEYGQSFLATERGYTDKALRQIVGPKVLQVGNIIDDRQLLNLDFPQLFVVQSDLEDLPAYTESNVRVIADAAFLPFAPDTISSVILPHALENNAYPHQVLREAYRVLRPEGYLILTGFNPMSLIGLQRHLHPKAVYKGEYYSVRRVRDWLQLLGFEVVGSALYHYAPLCKNVRLSKALRFLNSAGDRWLPMTGGSYMISARKREIGMRLVGRLRYPTSKKRRQKLVVSASAGNSSSSNVSTKVRDFM